MELMELFQKMKKKKNIQGDIHEEKKRRREEIKQSEIIENIIELN